MEGYHVAGTHPQLLPAGATNSPGGSRFVKLPEDQAYFVYWVATGAQQMSTEFDAQQFMETNIRFLRLLNEGMGGMIHEDEIAVAEQLRNLKLPKDVNKASKLWRKELSIALQRHYEGRGIAWPDLNAMDAACEGLTTGNVFCFPNTFILPMYGSASAYRIRPLGPEETLFELWSLNRYAPGEEPPRPTTPTPMEADDPSWPDIPAQDFSNLPRQQRGLHSPGFESMLLSKEFEGRISNYQRLIDGYLAGHDHEMLLNGAQASSGTIDVPIAEFAV